MLAIGLTSLVAIAFAWHFSRQKDLPTKTKEIDRFLTFYQQLNKFNGNVLVAKDGEILLNKSYGLRDAELQTPLDQKTAFRIYSVTKTFTSTLVFKLVELGKLSLTDKLSKFYPDIPSSEEITIEHLLTHTSGLYDYTRDEHFENSESTLIELLKSKPLDFEVGSKWSYCNSGYCLLGHIIAKASEMTYEDAVHQYIFQPLAMNDSGCDFEVAATANKATGYDIFADSIKRPAANMESSGPFSAGEIYSTVGDLFLFHEGLRSRKIISDESWKKATTPTKQNRGYACGWQISQNWMGPKVISHSGGASGFRSNFSHIPGKGLCVILLNSHQNCNTEFMTTSIYNILDGYQVVLPQEVKLSTSQFAKFVGFYEVTSDHPMLVRTYIVDGRLALELDGQPAGTLLAMDHRTFSQPEANGKILFIEEQGGHFNGIQIKLPWRKMTGNRSQGVWGVLGSATDGGWDGKEDIRLQKSADADNTWSIRDIPLNHGALKFRFDCNWNYNFGDNHCDGTLDRYGDNIPIEAGVYDIVLDLEDEFEPRYTLTRKR